MPPAYATWQEWATANAAAQGFSPVFLVEWDWITGASVGGVPYNPDYAPNVGPVDTVDIGTVGANGTGLLVVSFVALGPLDSEESMQSAVGYPAPNQGNDMTMSISTEPVDMNGTYGLAMTQTSPHIHTVVGTSARFGDYIPVVPGTRYFINVAAVTQAGVFTCDGSSTYGTCDFRFEGRTPAGRTP
jgi:hypothetical protein